MKTIVPIRLCGYDVFMKHATELFKALGDETRLRIMAILLDGNEYCVCDLMEALGMPQSTVSRHLAYLKNSGWVKSRRQKKWMYYRLNTENSHLMKDIIVALHASLPKMKQTIEDRNTLTNYLNKKDAGACS